MGETRYRDLEIRGVKYETAAAAAAALGVSSDAVRIAAKRGTLHRVGTGRVGREPMPVRIRGVDFPDAHAAAEHFGVSPHTVWAAIGMGDPDRVARKVPPPLPRLKPVTLYGVSFPSCAEASRQLGFGWSGYVSQALRRQNPVAQERIRAAVMRLVAEREVRAMRRVSAS